MSFSTDIKQEIMSQRMKRKGDAVAMLTAFALSTGTLKFVPKTKSWGIHFVSENESTVLYIAKIASQYFDLEFDLSVVEHERLNAVYKELLLYGGGLDDFLLATGFMYEDECGERNLGPVIPKENIETETQKRAFIRGAFLSCGTAVEPNKAYHVEFVLKNSVVADCLDELIRFFGFMPRRTKRKQNEIIYIKDGEQLENFLALIGASSAMMYLANIRIEKQALNEANRSVNCITANLERASKSALKQAEDIRLLISEIGFDALPEQLKPVAEARINNYEMALSDLADELGMGKSAVNYRLKKLKEMADDVRNGTLKGKRCKE